MNWYTSLRAWRTPTGRPFRRETQEEAVVETPSRERVVDGNGSRGAEDLRVDGKSGLIDVVFVGALVRLAGPLFRGEVGGLVEGRKIAVALAAWIVFAPWAVAFGQMV